MTVEEIIKQAKECVQQAEAKGITVGDLVELKVEPIVKWTIGFLKSDEIFTGCEDEDQLSELASVLVDLDDNIIDEIVATLKSEDVKSEDIESEDVESEDVESS